MQNPQTQTLGEAVLDPSPRRLPCRLPRAPPLLLRGETAVCVLKRIQKCSFFLLIIHA